MTYPAVGQPPAGPPPGSDRKRKRRLVWWIAGTSTAMLVMCCGALVVIGLTVQPEPTVTRGVSAPKAAAPAPVNREQKPDPTAPTIPTTPMPAEFGLTQTVAWWNRSLPTVPAERCREAGAPRAVWKRSAWQLTMGLACVEQGPNAWSDHIISVDVYFPASVAEQRAVKAVVAFLPADSEQTAVLDAINPDHSSSPDGSCREVEFTSKVLQSRLQALNPSWTGSLEKATVYLYTGEVPFEGGAERSYDPGRVNLASLQIGGANINADGNVYC